MLYGLPYGTTADMPAAITRGLAVAFREYAGSAASKEGVDALVLYSVDQIVRHQVGVSLTGGCTPPTQIYLVTCHPGPEPVLEPPFCACIPNLRILRMYSEFQIERSRTYVFPYLLQCAPGGVCNPSASVPHPALQ